MTTTLKEYVDVDVTKDVLGRYLGAVDTSELESDRVSMEKLVNFVLECCNAHYNGRNIDQIKRLDEITKTLKVPSRSGRNVANLINVSSNVNFI